MDNPKFDLIIVDFMPLIFSQPPAQIYTTQYPLETFCNWLVLSFLTPYLKSSPRVVLCIDRKDLEEDFLLKGETHKMRENRGDGSKNFVKLLSFLLDTNVEIVSNSYVPPFSWISNNR